MSGIWVPVSGQIAQERKIEVLANNVANSNSVGFKRDDTAFKEHLTEYENPSFDIDIPRKDFSTADMHRTRELQQAKVQSAGSYSDFTQGEVIPTNGPMDFAINGEGFFVIETPQGVRYTRKGNFNINAEGTLVTDKGYSVLGNIPTPESPNTYLQLKGKGAVQVDGSGNISQDGKAAGKLAMVHFADLHALKKEASGLFTAPQDMAPVESTKSVCMQGHLEQSNVNPILEMTELIKAHRQFESMQKAIQAYDSIGNKSVNEIVKF
ncbi:MAG: flagellar basal-body rod protein FlgF [Bacteriovoracaceae bacterium]|nr:flagellar basal-body rod protein FlgF [Bacteriovoracaceae bacterium]